MAKLTPYGKVLVMMSVIDENFARVFLQATPLREAVQASIDLDDFTNRINQLQRYSTSVFNSVSHDEEVDLEFLQKEVNWSIQQCDKNLKLLVPTENKTDTLQVTNAKTVLRLLMNYRQVLAEMLNRIKVLTK